MEGLLIETKQAAFVALEEAVFVRVGQGGEGVGYLPARVGVGVGGDEFVEPLLFHGPSLADAPPAAGHFVEDARVDAGEGGEAAEMVG